MVFFSHLHLTMHKKLEKLFFSLFLPNFFNQSKKKITTVCKGNRTGKVSHSCFIYPCFSCLYYPNDPLICKVEMIVDHVLWDKTWGKGFFFHPCLKGINDVSHKVFISCLIEIHSAKKRKKCKKIWWERHGDVTCADVGPVLSVFVHTYRMMIKFQITISFGS